MFKAIFLLFICVSAHAFTDRDGCYSEAQIKLKIMKSKNLKLSVPVEMAIADNLYYFCEINLSGVDSWVCVDRSAASIQKKSDIIHISPEFEIWFEGKNDEAQRPEISLYTEEVDVRTSRFNTFTLASDYKLTLERTARNYRLNGMAVDNRMGRNRSFKNVECFDVKSLTQYN
jgi:hypothetical protein